MYEPGLYWLPRFHQRCDPEVAHMRDLLENVEFETSELSNRARQLSDSIERAFASQASCGMDVR